MALSTCNTAVDSMGQELAEHGTAAFPIACYHDNLLQSEVPWHWHEELEAVLITEGSAVIAAGSSRQVISAGSGFFINSGILHGCWNEGAVPCRFHSIVFHPSLVGGTPESVLNLQYVKPLIHNSDLDWLPLYEDIPWQRQALDAIESVWQACLLEHPGHEFSVRNHLSDLLFLLWQHMPASGTFASAASLRHSQRIKAMLSYIQDHFAEELTVADIAASASISESECLRCFRNCIDATPIQYLKHYRIRRSARLLAISDSNISDIAACCGFLDISYFSKCFRELTGRTPSQYRSEKRRE